MNVREKRIAKLIEEQKFLSDQYKKAKEQARTTLNQAEKPLLEAQAENYKASYEAKSAEIKRLRRGDLLSLTKKELAAILAGEWRGKLHLMDNNTSEECFHDLLKGFDLQDAGLLLVQKGEAMKADLYLERIKLIMLNAGGYQAYKESFSEHDSLSGQDYLQRLANRLGCSPADKTAAQLQGEIIDALINSISLGQILYLEVICFEAKSTFYTWFREEFWPAVLQKLTAKPAIRVIALIMVQEAVHEESLPAEVYRDLNEFERTDYFEIELESWPQKEVKSWIYIHGSAPLAEFGTDEEINQLLPQLPPRAHKFSGDLPYHIYNNLLVPVIDLIAEKLAYDKNDI